MILYRVSIRSTGSLQSTSDQTCWDVETLYCGYDRDEARRVYHAHSHREDCRGCGSACVEVVAEHAEDSGGAFANDEWSWSAN